MLMVLLGIILLQSGLIFLTLQYSTDPAQSMGEVQTLLIVFFLIIFAYMVVIYSYIPFRMRKAFRDISKLINEISQGDYQIDIDSSIYDQDSDIQELIIALQKMLTIMIRFDNVKAEKIFEHHQRIYQLINILPQGIMICTINSDVVYCNDRMRNLYPNITETVNLNELIFTNPFDSRLFYAVTESIRYGNSLYRENIRDEKNGHTAVIDSSIIRNRKGNPSGSVFVIDFVENETED